MTDQQFDAWLDTMEGHCEEQIAAIHAFRAQIAAVRRAKNEEMERRKQEGSST